MTGHFERGLFAFLTDLAANNNRDWFRDNKARFTREAEGPMQRFIADVGMRLAEISPCYAGGSMFRIYRDTRFSKDKAPFKTNVAARFTHEAQGREHGTPGFYISLAPDWCGGGGGMHQPEPATLARLRDRIVARPSEWQQVLDSGVVIEGDALKRPPAGYDPEHRFVEDLKRKSFYGMARYTPEQVCAPDFLDQYIASCRQTAPLVRFITEALDLTW